MDKSFFSIDEIYNKGLVSLRIRNTLHRAKVFDTYHLARLNDKDLEKLPSVGAKTFNEIKELKEKVGLLGTKIKEIAPKEFKLKFLEKISKLKNYSLRNLHFSTRTKNCLSKENINSLFDLVSLNLHDLKKIDDFGVGCENEIMHFLEGNNLSLGYDLNSLTSKASDPSEVSYLDEYMPEIFNLEKIVVPKKAAISEKDKEIIKKWNSGEHTLETLGKEFGVTRERIRQILNNVKRKGYKLISSKEASDSRREKKFKEKYESLKMDFIDLYNEDWTLIKIAEKLRISSSLSNEIEKKLAEDGLIKKIYYRKSSQGLDDDKKRARWIKIRNYRKENKTLEEIGMLMNLSKPSIANTIRAMKDAGWEVPNSRNEDQYVNVRLSPEEIERRKAYILEGTLNGKSRKKLGEELGLDGGAISRFIAKYLSNEL